MRREHAIGSLHARLTELANERASLLRAHHVAMAAGSADTACQLLARANGRLHELRQVAESLRALECAEPRMLRGVGALSTCSTV